MNDTSAPGNNTRMLTAPSGEQGQGGQPGDNTRSATITHTGATTYSSDAETAEATYSSDQANESALLVTGGLVALDAPTINKTGSASGDDADFYGINAAALATSGATLNISGGTITTDGTHANAVFSYGTGTTINIAETTITTKSDTSGGIMVTGGGTLTADNLTIDTSGRSSAAIRSDRGGGTINVTGGTYVTHGIGSPAVYSTANINVKDASLISTSSEGVVIEGKNSVTLEQVILTDTNNQLNGQSETYKNIFIYQSMSGDATEGTGTFSAKNSTITTNQGDHFFITNTTATINLEHTDFIQNDQSGSFLRAATGKWGTSGQNGGQVTVNAKNQEITGDFNIDAASSLTLNLEASYVRAAFLGDGAKTLNISKDSIMVLTADSHLTELTNFASDNSNIYANGHKLYVGSTEVTNLNQSAAPASFITKNSDEITTIGIETIAVTEQPTGFPLWGWFAIGGGVLVLAFIGALVAYLCRKRKQSGPDFGTGHDSVAGDDYNSLNK